MSNSTIILSTNISLLWTTCLGWKKLIKVPQFEGKVRVSKWLMWVLNFTACQLVSISSMPKVVGSFAETTSSHLDVDLENEPPICKLNWLVVWGF